MDFHDIHVDQTQKTGNAINPDTHGFPTTTTLYGHWVDRLCNVRQRSASFMKKHFACFVTNEFKRSPSQMFERLTADPAPVAPELFSRWRYGTGYRSARRRLRHRDVSMQVAEQVRATVG